MDRKIYLSVLAALCTVAAVALLLLLALPILTPLAWGLVIGIATMPHYHRVLRRLKGRAGRSAGVMVFAVAVCFVLPVTALVLTAALNAPDWYAQAQQLFSTIANTGSNAMSHFPFADRLRSLVDRMGVDLAGIGGKIAERSSGIILGLAADLARNMLNFVGTLLIALFILFFIYRDGDRVVAVLIGRLAPDPRRAQRFAADVRSITTAVVVGTILTCASQGALAGAAYWVAGVPAPVFFGALTAIAALVPVIGTALVWIPLTLFIALSGSYLTAGLLAAWCVLFVGLADNAIRPLLVGSTGDVSTLAVILGAICGAAAMGLIGLIVGPVIFAVLFSLWHDLVSGVEAAGEGEPL